MTVEGCGNEERGAEGEKDGDTDMLFESSSVTFEGSENAF
jgi:hypothetical protein